MPTARPRSAAGLEACEHRLRQPPLEPVTRGAVAHDRARDGGTPRRSSVSIVSEKTSSPFSMTSRPDEADRHLVIADPERAPPCEIAPAGIEDLPIHAARPDADIIAHPLIAQHLRHGFGRREDRIATPIEAPQPSPAPAGFGEGQPVIARIGLEPGVDGRHHRQRRGCAPG